MEQNKITKEYLTQEKTAFHCKTKKEAKWLLNIANSYGITWINGYSVLTESNWGYHRKETCYNILSNGIVHYADKEWYRLSGFKIINVKELREKEMKQEDNLTEIQKKTIKEAFDQVVEIDTKEKMEHEFPFLKERKLPKSHAELCEINDKKNHRFYMVDYNFTSIHEKLEMLIELRDYYRDGWKPDWSNGDQYKFCLFISIEEWKIVGQRYDRELFSFQSKEIAEEFLNNFKDNLLEDIKPLFN